MDEKEEELGENKRKRKNT